MDNNFGGVIWTNHALQRLRERGIKQGDAWATWRNPQQSGYASSKGAWVYYKTYPVRLRNGASGYEKIEVVAKQNEKKQWVILSVWSRPVYETKKNTKSFMSLLIKRIFKKK